MKFWYPSLAWPSQNIRLLRITPEDADNVLKCTLTTGHAVGTPECPPYAALSYTWGPEHPVHEIEINGETLQIRENLWHFLRQLRRAKEGGYIWTDAICIDQRSKGEKSAQVTIMHLIYRNAAKVLVWLGETYEDSDRVFEDANNQPPLVHDTCEWALCQRIGSNHRAIPEHGMSPMLVITALVRLCARPYWSRTWILQEISLASLAFVDIFILCGSATTALPRLQHSIDSANRYLAARYISPISNQAACHTLARSTPHQLAQFDNPDGWPLEVLLRFTKDSCCTDPRDKIYAVQSMSSGPVIPVDYSISLIDLYWDVLYHSNTYSRDFVRALGEALGIVDHPGLEVLDTANRPGFIAISPFRRHRERIRAEKRRGGENETR